MLKIRYFGSYLSIAFDEQFCRVCESDKNLLLLERTKRARYLCYIWERARYRPLHHLRRNIHDQYDRELASRRGRLLEDLSQPGRASAWHLAIESKKKHFVVSFNVVFFFLGIMWYGEKPSIRFFNMTHI